MKALLIQHKEAGGGSTSRKALTEAIRRAGWKVDYLTRKQANPKAIEESDPDLVVVAGGDGTVAAVIRMVPDRSIPIAIVPTGTANDIARSLGIEGPPDRIIRAWDPNRRLRLDVGDVHGSWGCRPFAEGVGFGAFADSLVRAADIDGAAKLRAGRTALREAVAQAKPLDLDFNLDGDALPGGLLMAEFMIVPLSGPRLKLAPGAEPGDGKLHAAWVTEKDRTAMLDWLSHGGRGDAPVEWARGHEAVVRGGGAPMRIDDESCPLEPGSEVTIRVEGEPIQVLAPRNSPALAG